MPGNTASNSGVSIIEVENYCKKLYARYEHGEMFYHNVRHTELVVERSEEMAQYYSLSELDRFILITSAWFHDTGHLIGEAANHETKSISLMAGFLSGLNVEDNLLTQITDCILASRFPGRPFNLVQMILCDADLYHLGTELFITTNDLVKREIEVRSGTKISDWYSKSLIFLKHHNYFTNYCKNKLKAGKLRNIKHLTRLIAAS